MRGRTPKKEKTLEIHVLTIGNCILIKKLKGGKKILKIICFQIIFAVFFGRIPGTSEAY